jgi:predicted phosphodiesterase
MAMLPIALLLLLLTPPPFLREGPATIDEQVTAVSTPTPPFRIAILPDRTTGRDWGLPYLQAAVDDLNRIQPDAVFTVGDMIQGYTRDPAEWTRQADEWKAITDRLRMPLLPVAGNHDVISGSRVGGDDTFGRLYLERFGPLKYMAELEGATVIAMFSDETFGQGGVQLGDAQIGWLRTQLERARARGKPIVILMHRPLWRTGSVNWFERVHPLLAEAGVDLVLAGHFHSMQDEGTRDGVRYTIVGTCGGSIDQHPLAGQLQHISLVQLQPDGSVEVFHQPVGMTLPVDFVTRKDQDRVHALRQGPGAVKLEGALPDPTDAASSDTGQITVVLTNPIDVPIEVTLTPYTHPEPWPVEGHAFVSRTAIDAFNPHTVDADTPYRMTPPARPVTLSPGETLRLPLQFTWPRTREPLPPPTFRVQLTFTDSKGRRVPVFVWERPDVQRTVILSRGSQDQPPTDGLAWPLHAWRPSPYDTLEADPTMQAWLAADGQTLHLALHVPDQLPVGAAPAGTSPQRRERDPSADAIRVEWTDADGAAWVLAEPFTPFTGGSRPDGGLELQARRLPEGGWRATLAIPLVHGIPVTLNVGVADNDQTYHTQWRWLAPVGHPARCIEP